MGGAPSAEMMQQMQKKMFSKVDANADGGIDKSEMTNFAKQTGQDTSKVDELFKTADANGDNKIDESENSAMMKKIGEKMQSMFSQFQTGGSGTTTSSDKTNDVLMQMMDKIRDHSQQTGGTDSLKQFLANLDQQSGSYDSKGAKGSASFLSFYSQLA